MISKTTVRAAGLGAVLTLGLAAAAQAQPAMPKPAHDYKAAPAGTYAIDQNHAAVIVRIPHLGFSYSIFRFRTVAGTLTWDPANPAADQLTVTVDPGSIATADTGKVDFPAELSGPQFLDVAKFPTATFVSKAFHPTDATHGKVDGVLTIKGVTIPATFDVELVGDGQGFRAPVIGVAARTEFDAKGLGLPPFLAVPMQLFIDTEFDKKPG